MSTTFSTDVKAPHTTRLEPCMCAQMCDAFFRLYRDGDSSPEVLAELRREADPKCPTCGGNGVEHAAQPDPISYNTSRGSTLLAALGLPCEAHGQCSIADARRGLIRARNGNLGHLLSEDETVYGKPRANADGAVELRPVRVFARGLSAEGLSERLDAFAAFLENAVAAGATEITWD